MKILLLLLVLWPSLSEATTACFDVSGAMLSYARWDTVTCLGSTFVALPDGTDVDARTQKWDGAAVVSKTQVEIDAFDAAKATAKMTGEVDQKVLKAMLSYLRKRLNEVRQAPLTIWPALTIQDVRDGVVAEYQALP